MSPTTNDPKLSTIKNTVFVASTRSSEEIGGTVFVGTKQSAVHSGRTISSTRLSGVMRLKYAPKQTTPKNMSTKK